jgi:simple sugar transport system permease protein
VVEKLVETTPRAPARPLWRELLGRRELWTLTALLAIWLVLALLPGSQFLQIRNVNGRLLGSLIEIFNDSAPIMLLAIGMTLVVGTKGIDLSVGSVIAISGATAAVLIRTQSVEVSLLAAVAAGLLCGLWNGTLVALLNIQPFIATLILMVVGRGIAQLITSGQIAIFNNDALAFAGAGVLFSVPFPIFLALTAVIIVYLLVRRTALGLLIESVGANDRASYYTGINAASIKMLVYIISGLCAAIAGLIYMGYIKGADANNAGLLTELDAILAVVIGGTSLNGGRFHLIPSMLGVLIIQSLNTGILIRGVPSQYFLIVKAILILMILLLQSEEFRETLARGARRVRGAA